MDGYPRWIGCARLGVNVAVVSDNIRDSWSPFGNADQLSRAALAAYCSNWRSDAQLAEALPLVTSNPAKAVGRSADCSNPAIRRTSRS